MLKFRHLCRNPAYLWLICVPYRANAHALAGLYRVDYRVPIGFPPIVVLAALLYLKGVFYRGRLAAQGFLVLLGWRHICVRPGC